MSKGQQKKYMSTFVHTHTQTETERDPHVRREREERSE